MGSDLYYGKVLTQRRATPGWRSLTRYVDHPEFDEWGWALGLPDERVESVTDWDTLFEALRAHVEAVGLEPALAGCSRGLFFHPELLTAIRTERFESVADSDAYSYTQLAAVTEAMFAALAPERFEALELVEVELEAATMHPDAGFPDPDPDWKPRSFCLRLLTEADAEHYSSSRLYQHFERHAPDAWAQWEYGGGLDEAMGIVWRAERVRTIDLDVDEPEFWQRMADEWWTPLLRDYLKTPSDNHPYQAVSYRVVMPAGWLGPLSDAPYRSRAY